MENPLLVLRENAPKNSKRVVWAILWVSTTPGSPITLSWKASQKENYNSRTGDISAINAYVPIKPNSMIPIVVNSAKFEEDRSSAVKVKNRPFPYVRPYKIA